MNAGLARKYIPDEMRDDIRQECLMKILLGLRKFDPKRGDSFGFFWTIICNTIVTQQQKLTSRNTSLTPDDSDDSEESSTDTIIFQTPESSLILKQIANSLNDAFGFNNLELKGREKTAFNYIKKAVQSGEFFWNRSEVLRHVKRYGIPRGTTKQFEQYILVKIRQFLLTAK